ncbi:MAG: hypothetical protein CBARDMAM_0992 [uncultured Caballeronia sp.]|nr:MAG: hypothetical protein CBARDMAM_0992 [uncultured Caballeronia sp.]
MSSWSTHEPLTLSRVSPGACRSLVCPHFFRRCIALGLNRVCRQRPPGRKQQQQRWGGKGHFRALPGNRYGVLRSRSELRIEPLASLDPSGFQRLSFG